MDTASLLPGGSACFSFLFLAWAHWTEPSIQYWWRGEGRHPCLVPDLTGKHSPQGTTAASHRWSLSAWGSSLSFLISQELLKGIRSWILQNAFSIHLRWSCSFYFCSLVIWWITMINFQMLDNLCISGIKLALPWYIIIHLIYWCIICWNDILFRFFLKSVFMRDIGL